MKFHLYALKVSANVKIAMQCFQIFGMQMPQMPPWLSAWVWPWLLDKTDFCSPDAGEAMGNHCGNVKVPHNCEWTVTVHVMTNKYP